MEAIQNTVNEEVALLADSGIYEAIIDSAARYAPTSEIPRIDVIRKLLSQSPYLRDGNSDPLDFSRAAYATFVLSGAILIRICGTNPDFRIPDGAEGWDALLDWRRFETSPEAHQVAVEDLISYIPAMMQVTVRDMIETLLSWRAKPLRASIKSMMLQVGRYDAAGGMQMVDLAVSCLLPPIVRGIDQESTIYARYLNSTDRGEE